MKKTVFSEEQVAYALRQAEAGTPVVEVCRKLGVSEQTFYQWKCNYAGMGVTELRRLRLLEEENRKLKQLVADLPVVCWHGRDPSSEPEAPIQLSASAP